MEQKIAAAGTDASKLVDLIRGLGADLDKTKGFLTKSNNESAQRRIKLKEYEDADNARKKAEMVTLTE